MSFSPRYLVVANLILLALAAYSASSIVGTALAARFIAPSKVDISPPPAPIPEESAKPVAYYAMIHQRDVFNSLKPEPEPVEEEIAPITPLSLKLWGVAIHDAAASFCIIEDETKRKQGVYRVEDSVPGGAVVKAVEWDRVVLTRGGKDEILELEDVRSLSSQSRSRSGKRSSARGRRVASSSDGGIRKTGENHYKIDRAEVDNALENMSQLFTQIRAVPHFEGGESTGFRLFAIRRGSLFDRIGMKNGDIVRSINGSRMNDPTKALALLEDLRDVRSLTVEVTRNRRPMTLGYDIQ